MLYLVTFFIFIDEINLALLEISKIKRKFAVQKYTNAVIMIVFGLILLYLMGVFGNMRYGAMWKWNDASMIMSLGKANKSYPGWLSGLFFLVIYLFGFTAF